MAGVQSIERAFMVLRELSLGPAGVTEIAEQVGLPKSTVSRLLSALEAEGAVAQRDTGSEYELGAGLAALADAANNDANMAAVVRPFLIELSEATGESAGFVVRSGRNVYWVDSVDDEECRRAGAGPHRFLRAYALGPGGIGAACTLAA